MESFPNAQICVLKAQVQQMKAMLNLRKEGISPQFLAALDERIGSQLVTRVGNGVVLFRPRPIGKEQAEQ